MLGLLILLPFLIQMSLGWPLLDVAASGQEVVVKSTPDSGNEDEVSLIVMISVIVATFLLSLIVLLSVLVIRLLINRQKSVRLENSIPGAIDDEFEIEERLMELSTNEQNLYRAGQDFIKQYPPIDDELALSTLLVIQEKGIDAWEFIPDLNLPNDAILINNKTELNFTSFDYQCSIQANLPIPKVNDIYYYEAKIYSLDSPEDTIVSIGLSTRPYPYFRLPGRHLYSVAYDSDGSRRVNNSFKLTEAESSVFPPLNKGDVIGIGYRVRSGTIFFTRNGKKLSEKSVGGHIKGMKMNNIFPTIGANNPCSIHVNLGQSGYVFIEANIKKWGYASREGNRPPLPLYDYSSNDLLLESSNEDDDEIINPPDFLESAGYESVNTSSSSLMINDRITLNTLLPEEPPVYDDNLSDFDDHIASRNAENNQFINIDDILESTNVDTDARADDESMSYEARSASNPTRDDSQEDS